MESEEESGDSDELLGNLIENINQSRGETVANQSPTSRFRDPFHNTDYYLNFLRYMKFKPPDNKTGSEMKDEAQDEDPEKNNYSVPEDDLCTYMEDSIYSVENQGFSGEIARALDLESGFFEESSDNVADLGNETSQPRVVLVRDDKMFIQEITE